MSARARYSAGPAIAVALLLPGCVAPASTTAEYAEKAVMTAEDAVSAARTAVLATQAYADDRLPGTYLEPTLVDAEQTLDSVRATFDSVQPPDTAAADDLRRALDPLLEDAAGAATELRIAARRDDSEDVRRAGDDLAGAADALDAFAREHAP